MNSLFLTMMPEIPLAPTSIGGWIALILSFITLVTVLFGGGVAWGKFVGVINAFGARMDAEKQASDRAILALVERLAALEEAHDQHRTLVSKLLAAQEMLLVKIGESSKQSDNCNDQTRDLGISLGVKLLELQKGLTLLDKSVGDRLTRVETVISERLPKRRDPRDRDAARIDNEEF